MALVWALTGKRVGDNAQVMRLAEALGLEVHQIPLTYTAARILPNWLLGASLSPVAASARGALQPAWPDLVVGAGRRSVPVARWVQRQSGGKTRIVFLGRPRAPLTWFDLVITTPQYGLPREANVMTVALPFVGTPQAPADGDDWQARWSGLTRPLTAVLVGGSTTPYKLDEASIAKLVETSVRVADDGAAVFVTSPRTSASEVATLERMVDGAGEVVRWARDMPNPYGWLLAHANRFVVTEDSVSMAADAIATGKPVTIASVRRRPALSWRADAGVFRALAVRGLLTPPRDVHCLMLQLADSGLVEMPGRPASGMQSNGTLSDWPDAIARVKALLA